MAAEENAEIGASVSGDAPMTVAIEGWKSHSKLSLNETRGLMIAAGFMGSQVDGAVLNVLIWIEVDEVSAWKEVELADASIAIEHGSGAAVWKDEEGIWHAGQASDCGSGPDVDCRYCPRSKTGDPCDGPTHEGMREAKFAALHGVIKDKVEGEEN